MFSSFFTPKFPSAAFTFEAGQVLALSVKRSGKGSCEIDRVGSSPLDSAVLTPDFIETNIGDFDALSEQLEDAVAKAGLIGRKDWSAALPLEAAKVSILSLDATPASKRELEEILEWKAEKAFGLGADRLRLSFGKISNDAEGRGRYLVSAVALHVLEEYEDLFDGMGLKVGLTLPRAVCEADLLNRYLKDSDTLLLSTSTSSFTAMLMRAGEPLVVRSASSSSEERYDELYRLLLFYSDRFAGDDADLGGILLTGGGMESQDVRTVAEEALGGSPEILGPESFGLSSTPEDLQFAEIAAAYALASI